MVMAIHHHLQAAYTANPCNPFGDSFSDSVTPNAAVLHAVPIADHVPIKLSHDSANYHAWKTYFYLLFREYNLRDHVDGSADLLIMGRDSEWMAIDATIIRWFFLTVSPDIFKTVVREGDDTHTVWTKINGLFTNNKLQRVVFLQQEFFGTPQGDQTLDAYCLRLKAISDELHDLGFRIGDELLLSTLTAGLSEDLGNAASNLTLMTNPTFERAIDYLRLEERRLKGVRARAIHSALAAGISRPPTPTAPVAAPQQQLQQGGGGGGRRNRRRGRGGGRGGGPRPGYSQPPPPWSGGYNPWTGVVHAYTMPVPRPPAPGIIGPRPPTHQAFFAAPQHAPGGLPYGGLTPYAALPLAAPSPWDPALYTALQYAPPPGSYTGGGDWFMDTGASAHMAAHPATTAPHKLAPRTVPCVFLGYPANAKGYRCYDPISHRVITSRHVYFDEHCFPFAQAQVVAVPPSAADSPRRRPPVPATPPAPAGSPAAVPSSSDSGTATSSSTAPSSSDSGTAASSSAAPSSSTLGAATTPLPQPASPSSHVSGDTAPTSTPSASPSSPSSGDAPSPPPPPPAAGSLTHARAGISRPSTRYPSDENVCTTSTSAPSPLPASARAALRDPMWFAAMQEEFDALQRNQTWQLVPRPRHANIITGKWVFKHKFHPDGTLDRHKARWVVRGFRQRAGIDFTDTFAPVVKPGTIRTVLQLAVSRAWPVHQMDVSNAFLHGHLEEQVFCQQPTGFIDSAHPDHVCLLSRSLYGLKQAPRAWYQRIAAFLHQLGFRSTRSDASLFVYSQGADTAYLLLYVDDIILTACTTDLLRRLTDRLRAEFALKDLGPLHYFLGIEVVRRANGFFLHQRKYARELLDRAGMLNCKSAATPVDTKSKRSSPPRMEHQHLMRPPSTSL
ncbi:hypothetical protein ACQ4PT_015368 [Festuca glaucescens]